jgi:hypothetical protein
MGPAGAVLGLLFGREAAMSELESGAVAFGVEQDLDGGRPGRDRLAAGRPQVNTTRRGGSTTTYSPRIGTPLMSSTSLPPGVGSSSAQSPIHRAMSAGSMR